MNQIFIIQPYFYNGSWVFDDAEAGLVREPFVSGIPEMIDKLVEGIPGASEGFRLLFSADPFPEYDIELTRLREEIGGYWYQAKDTNHEGWLCPAMFKYFDTPPEHIYAKVEGIGSFHTRTPSTTIPISKDEVDAFARELECGNIDVMQIMLQELQKRFL